MKINYVCSQEYEYIRRGKESVLPCAKYRGQPVQYCTQSILSNPQRSSLVTTTIATSCSLALHARVVLWSHTWMYYHNTYASACNFGQFDLCIWQRVFAQGNTEYDTAQQNCFRVVNYHCYPACICTAGTRKVISLSVCCRCPHKNRQISRFRRQRARVLKTTNV